MHNGTTLITQEAKANALESFFSHQFGQTQTRQHPLNWESLQPGRHDLTDLDWVISEQEVHAAVMQAAPEKAPDGYRGVLQVLLGHN
jgi:hypothetical protein